MMRKIADALGVAVGEIADPLSLEKTGRKREPLPDYLPREVMDQPGFLAACHAHDLGAIFAAAVDDAGFTVSHLARRCEMSIGQVSAYMHDGRRPTVPVIIRVADGLRIPGEMLGVGPRPWEKDSGDRGLAVSQGKPTITARREAASACEAIVSLVEASNADAEEIIMSAGRELISPLVLEQFYER